MDSFASGRCREGKENVTCHKLRLGEGREDWEDYVSALAPLHDNTSLTAKKLLYGLLCHSSAISLTADCEKESVASTYGGLVSEAQNELEG
jgi:hypothetical protein